MNQSGARGGQGNLPQELTSFVGRRRELTEAKRLLSASRLVTLTGIGGVGKTRLALRVADDARRAFPDGVWLVELGELHDPDLVADAVAAALGLRQLPGHSPLTQLTDHLVERNLLLVLDNCEHLIDAIAALAEALLRCCPDLRILATSREPLSIGGEAVSRVPAMTVPDPHRPPHLQGLPQYEAVTLFVERAAAAVPGFALTEENRVAISSICYQLDGLPLPIELAAVRLRAMSVDQILERLTDRYRLLTKGSRGAPTRQQSLRMSIDWSHELCTDTEQVLWRRLSVFAGSFELDAAEGVCGEPDDAGALLDGVASLVDKSILIREEVDAGVRYRMLETIREYGRERLRDAGEFTAMRRRHRDWYEGIAATAESEWIGPRQVDWIRRLDREQSNLREAIAFSVTEPGGVDGALRIGTAMYPYWLCRGMSSEGRHWLDRALDRGPDLPSLDRVKALYVDSVLAGTQGDLRRAADLVARCRRVAAELRDPEADLLTNLAAASESLFAGSLTEAIPAFEAVIARFRASGDLLRLANALVGAAVSAGVLGEESRAISYHEEVLDITEEHGESAIREYSLLALALSRWSDDPDSASDLLEQGLRLGRVIDDPLGCSSCVEVLSWIAAADGRYRRAAVLMGAAQARSRAVGSPIVLLPNVLVYHEEAEKRTRDALAEGVFDAAWRQGGAMSCDDVLAYALGEQQVPAPAPEPEAVTLTRREQQVAELVAQGLTNRAIAGKLVISQRTAQGHVEHVLAKLGFSSRTQIAAWFVEQQTSRSGAPGDPVGGR
ncbi:ATP-binding protein [Rhodococcus sp. NPDC058505]|uniref:ATP-binding protein n=1 Tax=unclassified Rhodococcus (in: high G+C Gram-positive bacteria) TaxID=192944 RepID=UPI003647A7F4